MPVSWQKWRIVLNSAPTVRRWGDEYVVHHALSNDTYRVSATAGQILSELIAADMEHADVGNSLSLEDADVVIALSALAELGFVAQC